MRFHPFIGRLLSCASVVAFSATAFAQPAAKSQNGELEQIVVTATRIARPVSELTRPVTVISTEDIDIQKRLDRSLGSILSQKVPGFSPSTESLSDFGQTLRGRTFLTMVDGIPQSTPLRDGRRSLNTVDADAIEQVEVIRGGTAAYGFGATGGLVNIITRGPADTPLEGHSEAGMKLSTEQVDDSFEWHTNHRLSGRSGQLDYLVSGTFVERNGFFDAAGDRIPADPFGVQGGLADTTEWSGLGKLGYSFDGGRQRIEISAQHFDILQDSEWAGVSFEGNPETGQKTPAVRGNINPEKPGTRNTNLNLQYRHTDLLGSAVRAQVYYGDLTARFGKFPGFSQTEVLSEKTGARLTVDTPVQAGGSNINLIWGIDYLHDETTQNAVDGPNHTPAMDMNAFAGFAEAEVPIADLGQIRGGLRHETMEVDVEDVTNRQGIFVEGGTLDFDETLFNISGVAYLSEAIDLYGGFSQGFSLADLGRAVSDGTATAVTDFESEVQTVNNYEIGLRARHGRVSGELTGFLTKSDNGTTFNPDLEIAKQPEKIYGIEASVDWQVRADLELGGTFTWQEGRIDLDDDGDFDEDLPSTRVPPVKITGYAQYQAYDWWMVRLQGLRSGDRTPNSTQFGGGAVSHYTLFSLYNSFRLPAGELQIGVDNLFNKDYFTMLSQAGALSYAFSKGPGRRVSATYSIDW